MRVSGQRFTGQSGIIINSLEGLTCGPYHYQSKTGYQDGIFPITAIFFRVCQARSEGKGKRMQKSQPNRIPRQHPPLPRDMYECIRRGGIALALNGEGPKSLQVARMLHAQRERHWHLKLACPLVEQSGLARLE